MSEEYHVGHIVVFEGADRGPAFHRCEDLADAVSFVEKLRNERGVDNVQIFRTEEVRFDFKPYYRVELNAGSTSTSPALEASTAPSTPAMTPPPPIASMASPAEPEERSSYSEGPATTEADDDLSVTGARRGLFGR